MKSLYFHFSILLFFVGNIVAQTPQSLMDKVYGMDAQLYNGPIYSDYYSAKVKGQQFFKSADFMIGNINFLHGHYHKQQLNYDVYSQKLLLSFYNDNSSHRIIEVPLWHVKTFSLGKKNFQVYLQKDSSLKIFQRIGENDSLYFLIHWYKELKPYTAISEYEYVFSNIKRQIWLVKNGAMLAVNNNKAWRKLFPKAHEKSLKRWMRAHQIRIQRADDKSLLQLLKHCETL